jgi:hypothetical protein
VGLSDDPEFLLRPLGFAIGINATENLDVPVERQRLPGLLKFSRTFAGELLEKEFNTSLAGFPTPAREKIAALSARLKRSGPKSQAARKLMSTIVDICDLEIDRDETYGDEDNDEDEYFDEILALIQRLLDRFEDWIDSDRLPKLATEAKKACLEFSRASERLTL